MFTLRSIFRTSLPLLLLMFFGAADLAPLAAQSPASNTAVAVIDSRETDRPIAKTTQPASPKR